MFRGRGPRPPMGGPMRGGRGGHMRPQGKQGEKTSTFSNLFIYASNPLQQCLYKTNNIQEVTINNF